MKLELSHLLGVKVSFFILAYEHSDQSPFYLPPTYAFVENGFKRYFDYKLKSFQVAQIKRINTRQNRFLRQVIHDFQLLNKDNLFFILPDLKTSSCGKKREYRQEGKKIGNLRYQGPRTLTMERELFEKIILECRNEYWTDIQEKILIQTDLQVKEEPEIPKIVRKPGISVFKSMLGGISVDSLLFYFEAVRPFVPSGTFYGVFMYMHRKIDKFFLVIDLYSYKNLVSICYVQEFEAISYFYDLWSKTENLPMDSQEEPFGYGLDEDLTNKLQKIPDDAIFTFVDHLTLNSFRDLVERKLPNQKIAQWKYHVLDLCVLNQNKFTRVSEFSSSEKLRDVRLSKNTARFLAWCAHYQFLLSLSGNQEFLTVNAVRYLSCEEIFNFVLSTANFKEITPVVALDCEGLNHYPPSDIAIVNYFGHNILRLTFRSGGSYCLTLGNNNAQIITQAGAETVLNAYFKELKENNIEIVGQSIEKDFKALKLNIDEFKVIDVANLVIIEDPKMNYQVYSTSLQEKFYFFFQSKIQDPVHYPDEDAKAALCVYRICEQYFKEVNGKKSNTISWKTLARPQGERLLYIEL